MILQLEGGGNYINKEPNGEPGECDFRNRANMEEDNSPLGPRLLFCQITACLHPFYLHYYC